MSAAIERRYTVDEVAAILQVHAQTVRRWLREGTLYGEKYGRNWRIPASALGGVPTCGR